MVLPHCCTQKRVQESERVNLLHVREHPSTERRPRDIGYNRNSVAITVRITMTPTQNLWTPASESQTRGWYKLR